MGLLDSQLAGAPSHHVRASAGHDRHIDARAFEHVDAQTVGDLKTLELQRLAGLRDAIVDPAVRHHAVHVEDHQPDRARQARRNTVPFRHRQPRGSSRAPL